MLEKFRTEPFHNLYPRFGCRQSTLAYGGTCSDKARSFLESLRQKGVTASLHAGLIKRKAIHRLVKVTLGDRLFFADVGNGWPSIHLFPLDQEISYTCFGMSFRSVIEGEKLSIYNLRRGTEYHQMDVPFDSKPEDEILDDIAHRFDGSVVYPFSGKLRFSQVIGDRFLFLRDDRLEIYGSDEPFQVVEGVGRLDLAADLRSWFDFDLSLLTGAEAKGLS